MQQAHLPGRSLAYQIAGNDGTPVLLIMGIVMPGRAWQQQAEPLSRRHRVATFDHRGVGGSSPATHPLSMADLTNDVVGLLDHLGWPTAHIVGVSMGGMVAQHVALTARRRLRSLSLIATHPGGWRSRLPSARGVRHFLGTQAGPRSHRKQQVARLLFPDAFLQSCDSAWLDAILQRDFGTPVARRTLLCQLAAVARHDTRDRLSELAGLPTLVIEPGQDLLITPQACRRLAEAIPGAQLHTLAQAGHGVIRQCADEVSSILLAHFAHADGLLELSASVPT